MTSRSAIVRGTISSAAFADHQFVVGCWWSSPIGPVSDVMWSLPDGTRRLVTSSDREAEFICDIYEFDDVEITPMQISSDGRVTVVSGGGIEMELTGGFAWWSPPRPLWVTRWIEAPLARRLMGVETYGLSPLGRAEWYQARSLRWANSGRASLNSVDLGVPRPLNRPMSVGFSDPPKRPSIVSLSVTIRS